MVQIRFVQHEEAYLIPVSMIRDEARTVRSSSTDHLSSFDAFSRSMKVSAAAPSQWPANADLSLPFIASALPTLQQVMADHRAREVTAILHSVSRSTYGTESHESSWLCAPVTGIMICVALGSLRQYVQTVARLWSSKDRCISTYAVMSNFTPVLQALTVAGYISAPDLWGAASALARVCSHAIHTYEVDSSCAFVGAAHSSVTKSEPSTQKNSADDARSLTSDGEVGFNILASNTLPPSLSISSVTAVASSFMSGQLFASWGLSLTSTSGGGPNPAMKAADDLLDDVVTSLSKEVDARTAAFSHQVSALRTTSFTEIAGAEDPKLQTRGAIRDLIVFLLEFSLRILRWLTLREYCSHLIRMKPELAVSPGRSELSALPWAGHMSLPIAMRDGTIRFSSPPLDKTDVQLRSQLMGQYADVSADAVSAFMSGVTGYPLVDASMRCLRTMGYLPKPLYALLQNYWTKCLGQPWTRGMCRLAGSCIDSEPCTAAMQWQWNVGFVAGCKWAYPIDNPDVLCGQLPVSLMAKFVPQMADEAYIASRYPWNSWTRQHPFLPSHPHCMAHPAANEFAYKQDPFGTFVRTWLEHGELSPSLPDAFVYQPFAAPHQVLRTCNQGRTASTIRNTTTTDGRCSYYVPTISLARSRQRSLECVLAVMKHHVKGAAAGKLCDSPVSKELLKEYQSATSSTRAGDSGLMASDPVLSFLLNQAASGYNALWGTVAGWPLLVEEDAAILNEQQTARKEDGWAEIVDDPERFLKVYMQHRADSAVKTVLASSELRTHTCTQAFEAIDVLKKYKRWDKTWQRVHVIGEAVDLFTTTFYFLADAPPPPYSYLITQRDFVMFRYSFQNPFTGAGVNVLRNGSHASVPAATYIRGETLGCVGFMVSPLALPWKANSVVGKPAATAWTSGTAEREPAGARVVLMTAADPKGSIPAYLINFVAKRTPRMWVDRLLEACAEFAVEEEA
jgi:hypothetical protein